MTRRPCRLLKSARPSPSARANRLRQAVVPRRAGRHRAPDACATPLKFK
ncbi:hypothetical protein BURMUCGD2M_1342 [Burkholderia multivorans CGD2M]|uniref:Uncharacterized protein n=1 Tax=Burkholderia multivorans CGD2 TaxID=513052 RepID=B9BQC2_9BURK|nr:hypothetical protein BURMUCGD2_1249 [Burkholderia multivorans CGD2]EEE13241.1 hypothetical protein BURMUCGD2M_1342 [Burkholderia multivorans CGD2M]